MISDETIAEVKRVSEENQERHKMRYETRKGSESGHCCFEATVVDTQKDDNWVCECFNVEDAEKIAEALNKERT